MRPLRHLVPAALLAAAASACSGARTGPAPSTVAPSTLAPAPTPPAGAALPPCIGAPPPSRYAHVVWIVMENRGLTDVAGSPSAPYLASLAAGCGLAVDYSGVAHPSLPNYIAMTSGSTHGIGDDDGPDAHPLAGPSLFGLLGGDWKALEESMPADCDRHNAGRYAVKHNPAVYYTSVASACSTQDVPLDPAAPDVSARFTFITPNLCDDMHDCSTAAGDRWLGTEVPEILNSAAYRSGTTAVFITWDENDSGGSLVPTYVVAPSVVPGTRSSQPFDHYSLLRTTEDLLGVGPLLGKAATAADMGNAFHLAAPA